VAAKQDTPNADVKKLLRILKDAELFRDQQGRPHATFWHNGQSRTFLLDGKVDGVQSYLNTLAFERLKHRIGASDLTCVLDVIVTRARKGPMKEVFCRVGSAGDSIILDLCRDDDQVVHIHPGSWEVVAQSPVKFRRPKGMMALPQPAQQHEDLRTELARVFGIRSGHDQVLVAASLIGAFNPTIPLPVLELVGPQGAGKTTRAKAYRSLIDPNLAAVRRIPSNERDLFIAASNSWMLCLDNISFLPAWFSDAVCSIASGGGYATRKLYQDEAEALFQVRRPVVINSICEVVVRPDLRDRAVTISLPRIEATERRLEAEFWAEFHEAHPRILGALLDCVATALLLQDSIRPSRLPRMADWYRWVLAAAEDSAFGFPPAAFEAAFNASRRVSHELAIDAALVGHPLLNFAVEKRPEWRGTLSELLSELSARLGLDQRPADWPRSPEALRNAIDRIAPDLLEAGLAITFSRSATKGRERVVTLTTKAGLR
jgi:putative DNA primase/helicase